MSSFGLGRTGRNQAYRSDAQGRCDALWCCRQRLIAFLLLAFGMLIVPAQTTVAKSDESAPASSLYRVTTLRAAPGALLDLIALYRRAAAERMWSRSGDSTPLLMRHSQGDQWDLLVLQAIGSYADHYRKSRIRRRAEAGEAAFLAERDRLLVFREDLFAYGPDPAEVQARYRDNAFFHIEMFAALPGKHAELLRQRRMENAYLTAIKAPSNLIWVGDQGSDVDVFTIGFYPSIVEFAAPNAVSDAEAEAAAKAVGFQGRGFIGTYLRELIASHHDTLAVKVD